MQLRNVATNSSNYNKKINSLNSLVYLKKKLFKQHWHISL